MAGELRVNRETGHVTDNGTPVRPGVPLQSRVAFTLYVSPAVGLVHGAASGSFTWSPFGTPVGAMGEPPVRSPFTGFFSR